MKWSGGEYGVISAFKHVTCCRLPQGVSFDPCEIFGFNSLSLEARNLITEELSSKEIPHHLKAIDPEDPEFLGAKELTRVRAPSTVALSLLP